MQNEIVDKYVSGIVHKAVFSEHTWERAIQFDFFQAMSAHRIQNIYIYTHTHFHIHTSYIKSK